MKNNTNIINTSWIFRVQVIDCFMRFWGLSRLKFSMHFVFAACNWPTTSLASDTVCLCNLPRTCWGPNIRIPTIMLRTWEKISILKNSQKIEGNFYPSKKKNNSRSFLQSRAIFQLSWPKWTARPCDKEEDTSMSWECKNKILRNWRNMKEYEGTINKLTAYQYFSEQTNINNKASLHLRIIRILKHQISPISRPFLDPANDVAWGNFATVTTSSQLRPT